MIYWMVLSYCSSRQSVGIGPIVGCLALFSGSRKKGRTEVRWSEGAETSLDPNALS